MTPLRLDSHAQSPHKTPPGLNSKRDSIKNILFFLGVIGKLLYARFFTLRQTPVRRLMLYLKRGETLTYGTRESLTYGIGKTLSPFEVVGEVKMGRILRMSEWGRACCNLGFLQP